jgi:hypothetical protein
LFIRFRLYYGCTVAHSAYAWINPVPLVGDAAALQPCWPDLGTCDVDHSNTAFTTLKPPPVATEPEGQSAERDTAPPSVTVYLALGQHAI